MKMDEWRMALFISPTASFSQQGPNNAAKGLSSNVHARY
jgi:hypothetical protein